MFFVQLKNSRFSYLILILIITFGFLGMLAKAEEGSFLETDKIPEKSYEIVSGTSSEDYKAPDEDSADYEFYRKSNKIKKRSIHKNKLSINDSAFTNGNPVTLKDLIVKVSMVVFFLLGVLLFVKIFSSRNRFSEPGNLLDILTQKITGTFSSFANSSGLKLIQTLILTPGQNLYVVEVEGKKLLIGGTQHGGVQFLADLTTNKLNLLSNGNLNFQQIEDLQTQQNQNSTRHLQFGILNESKVNNEATAFAPAVSENQNNNTSQPFPNHGFKRRVNFKQSLLSKTNNGSCELINTL